MVLPQAWSTFVHYASFRFPPEPDGFYGYNALQQLAYFAAIFLFAPFSILTGNFGKPTGELGTVERTNEDDAVVKWDDDGRTRLHQPWLKKV